MTDELGEGFNTLSVCYNGKSMTKAELILYLYEIVDLRKEIDGFHNRLMEERQQSRELSRLMERQPVYLPVMEKPSGFAALFPSRKREYQKWLDAAPQREAERKRLEAAEDARIADLKMRMDKLKQNELTIEYMNKVGDRYKELIGLQVIAPQYRSDDIPELLLNYLFNGRAMTLSEAINIYHEELHRMQMMSVAKQQLAEVQKARQEQMDLAWKQMQILNEQRELQRQALKAAEDAKKAAQGAEYLSFLNLLT